MTLSELLIAEVERERDRSKRALERVPEGKYDWKPHETSMGFGYLAEIVAKIPSWIAYAINQDELDLSPPGGPQIKQEPLRTRADLLKELDNTVEQARAALRKTTDETLLNTSWRLLVSGNVVMELPRYTVIRDALNHMAHHRGQLTVYLRLLGAKVPAIYGPSADEQQFA